MESTDRTSAVDGTTRLQRDTQRQRGRRLLTVFGRAGASVGLCFGLVYIVVFDSPGLGLGLFVASALHLLSLWLMRRSKGLAVPITVLASGGMLAILVANIGRGGWAPAALSWLFLVPMLPWYLDEKAAARRIAAACMALLLGCFVTSFGQPNVPLVDAPLEAWQLLDLLGLAGVLVLGSAYAHLANRAWRQAHEREQRARKALELRERLEVVGTLAGGVAHDFNNVLTSVLNHASLAREGLGALDEAGIAHLREDLVAIEEAARRGGSMARQLLVGSRRDHQAESVLDPVALIGEIERSLRAQLGERGELVLVLEPAGHVCVDRYRLTQVLNNLVLNARDALAPKGRVQVGCRAVWHDEKDWVEITVEDDGEGMDAKTRARALEPFFTTKAMTTDTGTGLGLWTVLGVVEDAGGVLELSSQPGVGTRIRMLLPAAAAAVAQHEQHTPRTVSAAGGGRLLVVEDEAPIRRLLERVLTREGYSVTVAADGQEGLEAFEDLVAQRTPPVLVITDVMMPRLDGGELASRVRALRPEQPIALISGYTGDALTARGCPLPRELPLLQKPFDVHGLLGMVADTRANST